MDERYVQFGYRIDDSSNLSATSGLLDKIGAAQHIAQEKYSRSNISISAHLERATGGERAVFNGSTNPHGFYVRIDVRQKPSHTDGLVEEALGSFLKEVNLKPIATDGREDQALSDLVDRYSVTS